MRGEETGLGSADCIGEEESSKLAAPAFQPSRLLAKDIDPDEKKTLPWNAGPC